MSHFAVVVIAALIVVTVIIVFLWRKRNKPESIVGSGTAEKKFSPLVEQPPELSTTSISEKTEESQPASRAKTDDKDEIEAASRLEGARKDRKLMRLRQGLEPTRNGLTQKIAALFEGKKTLDPSFVNNLEEVLITADVGAKTADFLVGLVKESIEKNTTAEPDLVWKVLREKVRQVLSVGDQTTPIGADKPYIVMVVGVNGVGKTTTIGKLATRYRELGLKTVLAAADTFRAAAVNQLAIWGGRANAEVVKSSEGADPSSVVFEAVKKAKEISADVVIVDTAGRLHTKIPLMEELKKIGRVINKSNDKAPHEILLVLDATTGQNAVQQTAMFKEALGVTGLVLTKLDGTAKGGVIIGICHEHKIPIRFIGIGEAKDDLREFDVEDFVEALFFLKDKDKDN